MTIPEQAVQAAAKCYLDRTVSINETASSLAHAMLTAAAPHLAAVRVTGDDLVERVARAWASIDGKSDLFDECKFSKFMEDQNGTYEGYMAEARELIKRAALEPSAGRAAVLEEAARLDAATAALISLTEAGIPTDVQELLIVGDPSRGIAPGSLSKAIAMVIRALASHPVADKPDEAGAQGEGWLPTYWHKKRGTEYLLIGIGKMQADNWQVSREGFDQSVDMEEVAIYRSVDDGSLWVRPREEFEDGRFETLPTPPSGEVA